MPTEMIQIPFGLILNFGLVLCRTAGMMTFLPIPGLRTGLEIQRLALAVLFGVLLAPWARTEMPELTIGGIGRVAMTELALGVGLGLCMALIQEGIQMGVQMIGLQAGFSYASTIDPSSNADSAILQVVLNLGTSLLFLAMGLDTVLFRFLLTGVQTMPPGTWTLEQGHLGPVMALFPQLFIDAIRCSLPIVGTLLMVDVALALLSRIQPQLQLLTLSFPVKMLAAMALIAAGAPMLAGMVGRSAARSFEAMQYLLGAR